MCDSFTEDEIGNRVETADGEPVGVVAAVDGGVARVSPVPATEDRDPTAPSMAIGADETRPLEPSSVRERTAERIVLEEGRSLGLESPGADDSDRSTPSEDVADELEDVDSQRRGVDAEPTAVADREPEAQVDPDADDRRSDAEMVGEDDPRRTDAAIDRDDAEES